MMGVDEKQVLCVDFDNTLTTSVPTDWSGGDDPDPDLAVIEAVTEFWMDHNIIIVWTARRWSEAPNVVSWLIKHQVPFHGVMMQKGAGSFYVDDKATPIEVFKDQVNDV